MPRYQIPPHPPLGQTVVQMAWCPYSQKLLPVSVMEVEQNPNSTAFKHWVRSSDAWGAPPQVAPLGTPIEETIQRPPDKRPF